MLISNNNYARYCDFVFSETVDHKTFEALNNENLFITDQNKDLITYKSNCLEVGDGDSIFCRSDYIDELFYLIKTTELKNLKLLTHQTDIDINDKLLNKLPSNFEFWFGINKNSYSKKIISIPIGIAGNFSYKNLLLSDFEDINIENFNLSDKEAKIYLNFQKNTNIKERELAFKILKNYENSVIAEPTLSKDEYKKDLQRYAFILCPWGNGYDTHRVWEALYSGSIPIVKKHTSYEYLDSLPAIIVDRYEDILKIDLNKFIENFNISDFNLKKLSLEYWISEIRNKNSDSLKQPINISSKVTLYFYYKLKLKNKISSKLKKSSYYLRKLRIKLINLHKNLK